METHCPLCGRRVDTDHRRWCTCGAAMDTRCLENHDRFCARHGEDRWIGALEW